MGGRVIEGVPVHVPPVAGGVLVTCRYDTDIVLVVVQAPPFASKVAGNEHGGPASPTEMSMVPTSQDGSVPSAQLHPHAAGPPVGAVAHVTLVP
jgi:hypothetical protein